MKPLLSAFSRVAIVSLAAIVFTSCATRQVASGDQLATDFGEVADRKSVPSLIPEFFDTGPAIKSKMLKLIEEATDYILIDSYLVVIDSVTMEVMEALKEKHRSGVRIYVLADSSSRFMPPGKSGDKYLEAAGIPWAEYNPIRPYKLVVAPVMLLRDHRKFWIVDGRVLFLGGANILAASLNPPELGGNLDFMVAIESAQAIEQMIGSFVTEWNESSDEKLHVESFRVRANRNPESELWLFDQNTLFGRENTISKMNASLFALARKEVWLIQPYAFVDSNLIRQIKTMAARGVEVNLMLSGSVHAPRFHYASFYGIKDVIDAGGKVWVFRPANGFLHAKGIVIDGRWASIGSANLNHRSYYLSKEANVVFDDPRSVAKIVEILEDLKANCRPIELRESKLYRRGKYYITWRLMKWMG